MHSVWVFTFNCDHILENLLFGYQQIKIAKTQLQLFIYNFFK